MPDTTTKITFTPEELNKAGVQFVIKDEYALTRAIELKEKLGGTVTVLNVGEADTEPNIRKALAIGADDAIRVNAKPTDAFFVAQQCRQRQRRRLRYDSDFMALSGSVARYSVASA